MDRELTGYLPPALREVADFQAISAANGPEIALAWEALALVMADQFLDSAGEKGVGMWEKELGLYPKDTDALAARKLRLRAAWDMRPPFTAGWLLEWLKARYGALGAVKAAYDPDRYRLTVRAPYAEGWDHAEAAELLAWVIPCNVAVDWSLTRDARGEHRLYTGFAVRMGRRVTVGCAVPAELDVTYTADENGDILADEAGKRIIE